MQNDRQWSVPPYNHTNVPTVRNLIKRPIKKLAHAVKAIEGQGIDSRKHDANAMSHLLHDKASRLR